MSDAELRTRMRETLQALGAHPLVVAAGAEYCDTCSRALWCALVTGLDMAGVDMDDLFPEDYWSNTNKLHLTYAETHPLDPDDMLALLDTYAVDHAPNCDDSKGKNARIMRNSSKLMRFLATHALPNIHLRGRRKRSITT